MSRTCQVFLLCLDGKLLLEHRPSGVDYLTPLPAICSETPGRVDAGAEVLDVPGHGPQPCITRTSSRSSSCRRVAHCSYHDMSSISLFIGLCIWLALFHWCESWTRWAKEDLVYSTK